MKNKLFIIALVLMILLGVSKQDNVYSTSIPSAVAKNGLKESVKVLYSGVSNVKDIFSVYYSVVPTLINKTISIDESIFADKYYYNQLDKREKGIYRDIYRAYLNNSKSISFYSSNSRVEKAFLSLTNDFPELLWIQDYSESISLCNVNGFMLKNKYVDDLSGNQIKAEQEARKILETIDRSSEYSIVKGIHDYLIMNYSYSNDYAYNQGAMSSFLDKKTVCSGYARMFQYLCYLSDIECIFIFNNGHAFNQVKVDGVYYWIDVTWDDQYDDGSSKYDFISDSYFLVSDDRINDKSHELDSVNIDYHECPYNYSDLHMMEEE